MNENMEKLEGFEERFEEKLEKFWKKAGHHLRYIFNKWPYIIWFGCYFLLFRYIFNLRIVLVFYFLPVMLVLSGTSEYLWRFLCGVRPVRTLKEKERLLPLFESVFEQAKNKSFMSKKIKLYIQEDMEVNAYAFGKRTLVLTRGSIEFLNDDCLKGLIAHELGHFAHHDTKAALLAYVGNIYVSLFLRFLAYVARLFWPFNIIYKPVVFINDIPLLVTSRRQEYHADKFAFEIGFGEEMTQVLYALYAFIIEKPGSIQEQIRRTHPALTKRIERVEYLLTEIDNIPA